MITLDRSEQRTHTRTVLEKQVTDWRADRREAARARILDTAWALARQNGLSGLSLRDVARHLGMAAPSLYSYFSSKDALYDAMFAQGYRQLLDVGPIAAVDLREALHVSARLFADFCLADPTRYQLLFQRTIPGFEPSEDSYELAKQAYAQMAAPLHRLGVDAQADHDLITGVFVGLVAQQLANEPTTTRWVDLIDRAVDMLTEHLQHSLSPAGGDTAATAEPRRAASSKTSRSSK